ncbi:hypothetical protein PAE9249_04575 [Paenibacillus sp. CECT 9249]|nr:hypothetical protein PAE9249_04575 [Paenibacillus sp. CECT 9249]
MLHNVQPNCKYMAKMTRYDAMMLYILQDGDHLSMESRGNVVLCTA